MGNNRRLTFALLLGCAATPLPAEEPMSAIDWLSSSVSGAMPISMQPGSSAAVLPPVPGEPPVSGTGPVETVTVHSLDQPSADGLGLVPAARLGLPANLWGTTPERELATSLRKERLDTLPSVQGFLLDLMLAELDPPTNRAPNGHDVLFLARIDRLLDLGALEQAMALLEQADPDDAEIFRRRFDVALLLGQEDRACEIMEKSPAVAPSPPARIFCLARRGNWEDAELNLNTGHALGQITPEMTDLLELFLDDEAADGADDLPPPARPSPLTFRLMEAIGQPMATTMLPVAFAQADLRSNSGWKTQLDAAERLARMGVIDPNQLLGLYTQERASASGGVWERVALISELDRALSDGRSARVEQLLPQAWEEMQAQELEAPFAAMIVPRLAGLQLSGEAATLAFRMAMLTPDFEMSALSPPDTGTTTRFLAALARGNTNGTRAPDVLGMMLKRVFDAPPEEVPAAYAALVPDQLGAALLAAIDDISEGAKGDQRRVETGLKLLRKAGMESLARRTALELMVLERRG
ncbi:tetratricopeptide repeat protein [Rhodobacter aestuarii]|uniref:Tetratricopeptide repeat-containing protein n=2 Tax=Rhodobacter aestuarii TaxID=453582 RepID=A0A1N7JAD3_9RHOB|nr:tetratricopeptide repeat protein [Rhodobacter aestuarii]PTV97010.1 tetratricopeptide repeat protein [Rhodobacter aestuarii]SIS46216.1 Tetratricopeptide repeat-containing protein [Rhodobacter aestuarii]